MPQTLSAIPHFSPRPAGRTAAAKGLPQPAKDANTFASLLGVENSAKGSSPSVSKKQRSGTVLSEDADEAKAHENGDSTANQQTGTSVAANAAITDQTIQPQLTAALTPKCFRPDAA